MASDPRDDEEAGRAPAATPTTAPGAVEGTWASPYGPAPWPAVAPTRPAAPGRARSALFAALLVVLAVGGAVAGFVAGGAAPATPTTASAAGTVPAGSLAASVDRWVVDVNTVLGYQGAAAAGTGIVLSSTGEVLTNNHVVEGATRISVTDVGNGRTYSATVVGTDPTADIAVLQLSGASGLATAELGRSSSLAVGDVVTAFGNAGGVGGTPSQSTGTATALDQQITASDSLSGSAEQLAGMIETSATLQAGDSGGPLVDSSGRVVGVDTAGSSGSSLSDANANFAVPIDTALQIAREMEAGRASATVHIGPAAFLGVTIASGSGVGDSTQAGAVVAGVVAGAPADQAGLAAGDVIDSLAGRAVTSASALSSIVASLSPGAEVQVGWLDPAGQQHGATVQLASGPPA